MAINYLRRVQARNPNQPSDWERGITAGQQVGQLFGGLADAINAAKKNAVANQLMNTANAPRAAWVGGAAPAAGVPLTGTAPATGGVDELTMRRQAQKDALADALTRSQIAENIARTGGTGGFAKRAIGVKRGLSIGGGKTGVWGPGQTGDGRTDETDNEPQPLGENFDPDPKRRQQRVEQLLNMKNPNLSAATRNPKGGYDVPDGKGNIVTVAEDDFNIAWDQQQAARHADKLPPRPRPGETVDPTLGTNANPEVLSSENPTDLQRRSRPPGYIWRTPSGAMVQN